MLSRRIVDVVGRQILDSRGTPTLEAEVALENGIVGRAAVPSGASVGSGEAFELRDDESEEYGGRGVLNAVANVEGPLADALRGRDVCDQLEIDRIAIELDGTRNKKKLGANAILAVSLACAKAGAAACNLPLYRYLGGVGARTLPVPIANLINGGAHANNRLDVQEFMIEPLGFETFSDALRACVDVFQSLKQILHKRGKSTSVGDEGGFAPVLKSNEEGLALLVEAIDAAGYAPGKDVFLALDVAASEFYRENRYCFENQKLTSLEFIEILAAWTQKYPIASIEDGCAEDDWSGWRRLTERLGDKIQLVGDDLFTTNVRRLQRGVDENVANAILVKPNQIGSVSETLDAVEMARRNGYAAVVSHRSGETEDAFVADLAVATNCGQIKIGYVVRGERVAKYNQLLRIEEELGANAIYGGEYFEFEESENEF